MTVGEKKLGNKKGREKLIGDHAIIFIVHFYRTLEY